MIDTECIKCGVAFNVGNETCVEPGCYKPRKIYKAKRIDPTLSRYRTVKYRAQKKQIAFDLTQELITNIINSPCVYCGDTEGIQLDRKVGELGYTADNVVPACKRCNTVKSMYLTHVEMMIVAEALGWLKPNILDDINGNK